MPAKIQACVLLLNRILLSDKSEIQITRHITNVEANHLQSSAKGSSSPRLQHRLAQRAGFEIERW
jgi:hypothetical protein